MVPSVNGEEELAAPSDDVLEYDEQASLNESEDSGSEFEVSGQEIAGSGSEDEAAAEDELQAYAQALEEEGVDANDVLLSAAVQESLEATRQTDAVRQGTSSRGAGSSSCKKRSAREILRTAAAAAAERRLKITASVENIDVDDYVQDSEDDSSASFSDSDDSDTPLSKLKGKRKAKPQKAGKTAVRSEAVVLTLDDIRQRKAEKRAAAKARREEERALKDKLGRKITQVRCLNSFSLT